MRYQHAAIIFALCVFPLETEAAGGLSVTSYRCLKTGSGKSAAAEPRPTPGLAETLLYVLFFPVFLAEAANERRVVVPPAGARIP